MGIVWEHRGKNGAIFCREPKQSKFLSLIISQTLSSKCQWRTSFGRDFHLYFINVSTAFRVPHLLHHSTHIIDEKMALELVSNSWPPLIEKVGARRYFRNTANSAKLKLLAKELSTISNLEHFVCERLLPFHFHSRELTKLTSIARRSHKYLSNTKNLTHAQISLGKFNKWISLAFDIPRSHPSDK